MKKFFLMLAATALFFSANAITSPTATSPASTVEVNEWVKVDAWIGKDGKTWYKHDKLTMDIKYSTDGTKWEKVKDGLWQDKSGKWLQIKDKKLVWSADGGKTWTEVPESKWEGGDGHWYKFDSDWNLWKN